MSHIKNPHNPLRFLPIIDAIIAHRKTSDTFEELWPVAPRAGVPGQEGKAVRERLYYPLGSFNALLFC
jgi:hypothetical protein